MSTLLNFILAVVFAFIAATNVESDRARFAILLFAVLYGTAPKVEEKK